MFTFKRDMFYLCAGGLLFPIVIIWLGKKGVFGNISLGLVLLVTLVTGVLFAHRLARSKRPK
jgi:hypothetical protein